MKNKIFKAIKDFNLLENTCSIVIGVSGGIDSVSLLHFFLNNFKNIKIIVAHINHNLRGQESLRDENFVKKLCDNLKIECITGSFDILKISKIKKTGIEETARKIRYDFFEKISKKNNSKIATAHTLSDNIETVFLNLTRGCSLSGLIGIPAKRDNIIRPMIYVTRTEIENYVKNNNLSYVSDSSNFLNIYSRNKIRNIIIPEFVKINKKFEQNISRFITNIRIENEYLDKLSKEIFFKINFECEKIKILPSALKNRVFKLILNYFSTNINIESKHIKLADYLVNNKIHAFNLPGNKKLIIKNGFLVCEDSNKTENFKSFNSKNFFIRVISVHDLNLNLNLNFKYKESKDFLFDLKKDVSNFEFRTKKEKDVFCPQGRGCTKILRKLFNELKIPVQKRKELGILVDKSCGDLVWVESIGVSEKYKINNNSRLIGEICVK